MVKADILGLFLGLEENRSSIFQYDVAIQFSSVAQSCPTLYDPMDCSTPDFPVHHQLPELALTHVYRVSDAIPPTLAPFISISPLVWWVCIVLCQLS